MSAKIDAPAAPVGGTAAGPAAFKSISSLSLGLLALLTLFWGINWPIMKIALAEIPVFTFRAFCLIGGAAGLFALAILRGNRLLPPRSHWWRLAVIALFNITLWNVLVLYGLKMMPAGRASILAFTMPLWLAPLSAIILKERLTSAKLTGLMVGLCGMALLIGGEFEAIAAAPIGVALVLGAAISWAFGTVMIKRFPVQLPSFSFVGWQMTLASIPILIGALVFEHDRSISYSLAAWSGLFYNMIVCFIFCYWAWNRLVMELPAQISGLSTQMIPVVGVFSSVLMLGERPGIAEYGALVLVAVALMLTLRPARS